MMVDFDDTSLAAAIVASEAMTTYLRGLRNYRICQRVEAGDTKAAVARAYGITAVAVGQIVAAGADAALAPAPAAMELPVGADAVRWSQAVQDDKRLAIALDAGRRQAAGEGAGGLASPAPAPAPAVSGVPVLLRGQSIHGG